MGATASGCHTLPDGDELPDKLTLEQVIAAADGHWKPQYSVLFDRFAEDGSLSTVHYLMLVGTIRQSLLDEQGGQAGVDAGDDGDVGTEVHVSLFHLDGRSLERDIRDGRTIAYVKQLVGSEWGYTPMLLSLFSEGQESPAKDSDKLASMPSLNLFVMIEQAIAVGETLECMYNYEQLQYGELGFVEDYSPDCACIVGEGTCLCANYWWPVTVVEVRPDQTEIKVSYNG